ncbi:MAG TPA: hypothetical protein VMH20_07120 [Verrucomicrobiae bacterium]|nr:hypothetical protein [Verrucomicrobiae bacterium]
MKKVLWGVLLIAGLACGVCAQDAGVSPARTNTSSNFSDNFSAPLTLSPSNAAGDFSLSNSPSTANLFPSSPTPAAAPDPNPTPKYVFFGERDDYRWQLGVGFDYVHFNSRAFDTNMYGLNTTLTYYTNTWFALEGTAIEVFGPTLFNSNDHAKMFAGAGGIRIGGRRARWEPYGHGLVGGSHLQVQTAYGGRNALFALAGLGIDYRVHSRLSLRAEADWMYTGYFSEAQNNFQLVGGAVFHF